MAEFDPDDNFASAAALMEEPTPFIRASDFTPKDPDRAFLQNTGLRVRGGLSLALCVASLAAKAADPAIIVELREQEAIRAAASGDDLEDDSFGDDAPEVTRVAVAKAPVTGDLLDGCTFDGLNGPDYLKQQEESTAFTLHPLELAPTRG